MLVGEILDEIMSALDLKQGTLAKKIDVSQGTISKWKSGTQSPNLNQWAPVEALIRKNPKLARSFSALPLAVKPADASYERPARDGS